MDALRKLPAELWLRCFQSLDAESLCFSIAPTCHAFSILASDDVLWHALKAPNWTTTPKESLKSVWIRWIRRHGLELIPPRFVHHQPIIASADRVSKTIHLAFVGAANSGKTSIVRQYCLHRFDEAYVPTESVDEWREHVVMIKGNGERELLELVVWDHASIPRVVGGVDGVFVCGDLTDGMSMELAELTAMQCVNQRVVLLVGTKADMEKQRVMLPDGMSVQQVCCRSREMVEGLFEEMLTRLMVVDIPWEERPRWTPSSEVLLRRLRRMQRQSRHAVVSTSTAS